MNRPYLLAPRIAGLPVRLVSASSRAGALAIAAATTWEATPADAVTVRACGIIGVTVEAPEQGELLPSEGGEA